MSIEEGSSASGKKRIGQFDYMTMEEARREEASLREELAKMKSGLESIESKISEYDRKFSDYKQRNEMEGANQYLTMWNTKSEEKKSLVSRIDRAEGNLSELRESMSKKARMIQEGLLMPISVLILLCTVTFVVNY